MHFSDPAAVEAAFYAAFRELDDAAMSRIWLQSPDASCIHPGGALLQGAAQVLESWQEIFRETSPPKVSYRVVRTSADARLAVHTVEERVSSGAGTRHAVILATNVYTFADGSWRMLAHHASLPLVEKATTEPSQSPSLH
ncbi:MAG: nuclear transport factor 2 family protein [Chromatiaceae bacterium]|nr:nuclear transport factor 2 family protein [Chromatiaceae bacterium]